MGMIMFNGITSERYGIIVESPPNYEIPERDYELIHVPGRNGDLVIDKGTYKNVTRTYKIAVGALGNRFPFKAQGIAEWLCSHSGYVRLEDSYDPAHYRMAIFKGPATIENILQNAGRAEITFECKPQRYFKKGDDWWSSSPTPIITNPTKFTSLPLIYLGTEPGIGGAGGVMIGGIVVTISDVASGVFIDCELGEVYYETPQPSAIRFLASSGFPILKPGNTEVSFSGGVDFVDIAPKWWTI